MCEKPCRLWHRMLEEMDFHKNSQILEKSILPWYRSPKHIIFRVLRARDARFQAIDDDSLFSRNKVQVQYWPVRSAKIKKFTKKNKKRDFFGLFEKNIPTDRLQKSWNLRFSRFYDVSCQIRLEELNWRRSLRRRAGCADQFGVPLIVT